MYITEDQGNIFVDLSSTQRIQLNAKHSTTTDKWKTARTISLTGDATGSASVDGSKNVSITTTIKDASASTKGLISAADKAKLDTIKPKATPVYYAVCSTAAATAAKEITVDDSFELITGAQVVISFTNANSASSPTLNVNGTGAKPMYRYGTTAISTSTATSGWRAGAMQIFVYDGTGWTRTFWENSTYSNAGLGQGYATCSTAASTLAKTAALSSYALSTGGIVAVKFTYAVPASATLNINSKGAKNIFYRGSAITADVIKAGDTATFMYDGTQYQLLAIDREDNDDVKVTNTLNTTAKAYVTGTTSATTNTGTQVFDTGVYLDTTAGQLVATTFKGSLDGNAATATKATQDSNGNNIATTYETKANSASRVSILKSELNPLITANTEAIEALNTNKQNNITGAATSIIDANLGASKALVSDASGKVAASSVTSTELGYVSGVKSNIQTQLNAKQATITGAASTVANDDLTPSMAVVSNSAGKLASSSKVSITELEYLDGVTSNIQAQLNSKQGVINNLPTNSVVISNDDGGLSVSSVTDQELLNLANSTSNIQTQLNAKQATITGGASSITSNNLTASRALVSDASGKVAASDITSTELGYLDGVKSNVQTQLDGKQTTINGAASTVVSNNLTASRVVVSDSSGKLAASSSITTTELGYLDGVSSNIQTQLNSKQATVNGAASSIVSDNLTTDRVLISNSSGKVGASGITTTELNQLDGIDTTKTIQAQLDSLDTGIENAKIYTDETVAAMGETKQNNITGAASTITTNNLTPSKVAVSNASGKITSSDISTTELGYLSGTTSNIQTQLTNLNTGITNLNTSVSALEQNKQNNITGAATTIVSSNLTPSKALVSNASGKVAVSSVSSTELGYLSGVTSSVQTQLNAKASKDIATSSANGLMSAADKTKLDYTNIAYGTCTTAAATADKVITLNGNSNWSLTPGSVIVIKFSETNSANNPTLNVNSTGAKSVYYNTGVLTSSSLSYAGYANRYITYVYDGTNYVFQGWSYDANSTYSNASLGQGYATCSTAAATVAKVASLSSYALTTGGIVAVKFSYDVPASATLNINSKGAKNIYYRGAAITSGIIKAGDIATFIYSSQYHLISIDRWQEDIKQLNTDLAAANTEIDGSIKELSVNGKVITYTKNDGTTGTITTQDTNTTSFTITANASDDDIVVLSGTNGTNAVTYSASHAKKGPSTTASTTKGATADATISGAGGTGSIKVPKVTVDQYGHTTGLTEQTITVTIPSSIKNPNALTVGSKTYDGSSAISISASDLGLASAMRLLGTTTTAITDGATTNPVTVDGTSTTAKTGDVVLYGNKEFVFTNGSKWEELGNEGSYKVVQTAVSSPSASGNAVAFIDTISQNTQGVITATKKTVSDATTSAAGLMSAADKTKLNGIAAGANAYVLPTASSTVLGGVTTSSTVTSTTGLTPTPIINGVPYYKDTTYTLDSFGITATATELNYVDGVTSAIQTQLDGKAPKSHASTGTTYGVSTASAYGHAMASSTTPKANGTAAVGSETAKFARGDHVHPLQTSVSGAAGSATNDSAGQNIADTYIKGLSVSGTTITYTKGDGDTGTITTQDTNDKVKQTASTTDGNYPILMSSTTAPTSGSTNTAVYNTGITINPSTKNITATTFTGNLSGNATSLTGLTSTVAELNVLDGITATTAELNYVDGVTSNIQTQLDGKQASITGGASTITSSNLTASRALVSNSSGKVAVSNVTSTELGYLSGTTSSVQTQLNAKASKDVATTSANGLMSSTDKTKLDGIRAKATPNYYGECSTAADTAAKEVTVADTFVLEKGAQVTVKFTNSNSASTPTLNVNGTGAKAIKRYGTTAVSTGTTTTGWTAGAVQLFTYDGTNWVRDYWNNTTYSAMTAATADAAGKAGLVPAPGAGKQNYFLRGDGTWAVPTNTTYSAMTGATASAAGKTGLVPAPAAGNQGLFLRGDGTWATPTDTNTDTKVTQTSSTTNGNYPILLASSTSPTSGGASTSLYNTGITVNPSTKTITATTFSGALSGNATSATKATQDGSGNTITSTYIKGLSVSGKVITYTKGDGTTGTITTQDNNTDTKVKQTASTTDGNYPILLASSTSPTSGSASTSLYNTSVKVNPSTGTIDAKLINRNGIEISRIFGSLIPYGTAVAENANLNTVDYLKIGNYYCSKNVTVATLTNCPTSSAFMMQVYSPLSTALDNEGTGTWVYRLRKLLDYAGNEFVQQVYSNATAGNFSYGNWNKVIKSNNTATASDAGIIKVSSVNSSAVTVNSESTTAGRYYPVELNNDGKAIVNVPWTDTNTNTTYTAGKGLSLSGTEFKPNLSSETSLGTIGSTSKLYAVGLDANNRLCVNVPWTDNNTTYSAATASALGLVKVGAVRSSAVTVNSASSTASRYYPVEMNTDQKLFVNVPWSDTNTNTTYSNGVGLALSGTTFKTKLSSETSLGTIGSTSKLYAVGVDANGNLCVNVPWTDTNTNTTYTAGTAITLTGTQFSISAANVSTMINLLGEGTSPAEQDDYLVAQYANGNALGNTTYYRRKVKNIVNAANVKAALGTGSGTAKYLREDGTWVQPPNTTYSAGKGLTLSSSTFKANLNSETSLGTIGTTSKLYAVGVDANNKLCVSVPWTDNNTTYSAGTGLSLSSTTFSLATSGVTAGTYGPSANVSGSNGQTISVPEITVDTYGRVTKVTNRTYTSVDTNTNTDTKVTTSAKTTGQGYVTTCAGAGTGELYYHTSVYVNHVSGVLMGAAWNDYAEYRETKVEIEPGRVVLETGNGDLVLSQERLAPAPNVVSDTFGFAIGQTEICNTPIAVAGRALVYPFEDRENFKAGDAVCAGPNGTVSLMTREEIREYPDRILGIVSEIPNYETWGETNISVNNRIWIKIK